MSKRNSKPKTPKEYAPLPFYGFIQYNLTDGEKQFLKEQGVDHDRIWDSAEGAIDEGWTFKFSWDGYNQCYQVVVGQKHPDSPQAGYLLSGRGSSPIKALRQALYIGEQIGWDLATQFKNQQRPVDEIDD